MSEVCTLELECFPDELSPIQLETYEKSEQEHNEIRAKLTDIMRGSSSENIFSGNIFSAYQLTGLVTGLESYAKAPAAIRTQNRKIVKELKTSSKASVLTISDDEEDSVPLAKRVTTPSRSAPKIMPAPPPKRSATKAPPPPEPVQIAPPVKVSKAAPAASGGQKPTEANSYGGLLVGVQKAPEIKDKSIVDSQEVSFSKLQGKTYPSLVVFVRPTLIPRESLPNDRQTLDFKVKSVLMYTPSKFTEWLIQEGLVRSEQECHIHPGTALKLGMYSDVARFGYSGGYVWISECCYQRFTSVYSGSIFEESTQTPSILLKLIYHWSCQTNVQNVVQWVKVTSLFIKQFYTNLRALCTVALYNHFKLLGGPGKRIEVGVISLGTSSADGAQRQVKVEVLGVYDPISKQIRLRAIEPLPYSEKVYRKRFLKILEPLVDWVHEDTIILTDLTVDKTTLHNYGFRNVIQSNPAEVGTNQRALQNSNVRIMDYLRRVVPRMFQNTLSLLNRSMIQQFLDELVWREIYGSTPNSAFENMLKTISEQTRASPRDRIAPRLAKVSINPFKNWKVSAAGAKQKQQAAAVPVKVSAVQMSPVPARKTPAPPPPPPVTSSQKRKRSPPRPVARPPVQAKRAAPPPPPPAAKRPYNKKVVEPPPPPPPVDNISLEGYYYGIHVPRESEQKKDSCEDVVFEVKCPECELTFVTNLELQDHLFDHVGTVDVTTNKYQCRYCFERSRDHDHLMRHIMDTHPIEVNRNGAFFDLICEQKFATTAKLAIHMARSHYPSELPYRCGCCTFASSSRRMTIDHFYEEHGKSATLMCPLCMQMFVCANRQDGALNQNVNAFLEHLKEHRWKGVKPCPRCKLTFVGLGQMRVHMMLDHGSGYEDQLQPISKSNTNIPRPKSKVLPAGIDTFVRIVESAKNLVLDVPNGRMCLECGLDFDTTNHIVGRVQCPMCFMVTYCLPSALEHAQRCGLQPTKFALDQEYHCVCEYSTKDGAALVRHMVACERRSAYPSADLAKENMQKPDLLDGLGLVRREGEQEGVAGEGGDGDTTVADETVGEAEVSADQTQMELGEGMPEASIAEPVEMETAVGEGYLAADDYNPNLSLADLAPTPSVIVQHMPDGVVRDDYQDLQTPQVPDSHLMGYGHTDDAIVQQVVHGDSEQVLQGDMYVGTHQDDQHHFQGY